MAPNGIGAGDPQPMTEEQELEHAVQVALGHTIDAQADVDQEIAERDVPDLDSVDTVVHRAEDLDVLVSQSAMERDARAAEADPDEPGV